MLILQFCSVNHAYIYPLFFADEVGPGADWQPHFCVLLQDRGVLAAYRSEDMAVSHELF